MSTQESSGDDSSYSHRSREIIDLSPVLTSHNAGWNNISLASYDVPPGETPEHYLDQYSIAINIGQGFKLEQVLEGMLQRGFVSPGGVGLYPSHCHRSYYGDRHTQIICLNLSTELFSLHTIELLETDRVEMLPCFSVQDKLIQQIGLALQTELRSQSSSGRLYAETMANALTVHLLRHYSNQGHRTIACNGGLPQHKLRLVMDYINDYLGRELSLSELAAIAQLSQYHFCRAFKQTTGLSPHQYLIQQRVERAKQLLKQGEMTIGEVAIACGFTHQSHLNRHFKRLTGVTPKTFLNL